MSIFPAFHKKEQSVKKAKPETKKVASKKKSASVVSKPSPKKVAESKIASTSGKKSGEKKVPSTITGKIKKTDRPAVIFKLPHVSEKATWLEEQGKYMFRVDPRTNKVEVKKAFEEMYRTKVISVKIINIPKKKRTWRGKIGYRPGYKKVIIQVAKDQKVNIH